MTQTYAHTPTATALRPRDYLGKREPWIKVARPSVPTTLSRQVNRFLLRRKWWAKYQVAFNSRGHQPRAQRRLEAHDYAWLALREQAAGA